ncbi:MAG: GNAT family N-acetyltransferase [Lachnospiraceae bacterium]|nr:GNAT family N-acetyltransferase [Lachnospiraceae bacterium]
MESIDNNRITIRPAKPEEWDNAMELAFRVFLKYESKDYGKEGTQAFAEFVTDPMLKKAFDSGYYVVFLAFIDDVLVGMIGIRNGNHISLLFVDGNYHNLGIGRKLINKAASYLRSNTEFSKMTVNSAPVAKDFYHKLGFTDCGEMAHKDGIIYIPMEMDLYCDC